MSRVWVLICRVHFTVCYWHVRYVFQSECTFCNCLNVRELAAQNRRNIWSLSDNNRTWTLNQLVCKRTLNHSSVYLFIYKLSVCGFGSRYCHYFLYVYLHAKIKLTHSFFLEILLKKKTKIWPAKNIYGYNLTIWNIS